MAINDFGDFDTWLTLDQVPEFASLWFGDNDGVDGNSFGLEHFLKHILQPLLDYTKPEIILWRFTRQGYGREFDLYFDDEKLVALLPDYFYGVDADDESCMVYSDLAAAVEGLTDKQRKEEEFVSNGHGPDDLGVDGHIVSMWWD